MKNLFLRLACRHRSPAWRLALLCPLILLGGSIWLASQTGAAARGRDGTSKADAGVRQIATAEPSGTGSPTELYVDDGSFESALRSTRGEPESYVNLLTPFGYPATLTGVSIFFPSAAPPVGTSITLLVGNKASGDDQNTNFQTLDSVIQRTGQFVTYDFPAFTITSGDFVVGFRTTSAPGQFPIALDVTPPLQRRSYMAIHGLTFWLVDDLGFAGNLGIRARIAASANSAPTLVSLNPLAITAGSGALMLTVTGTNFVNGSVVRWNDGNRATTFVSAMRLTAAITAADIATTGTARVTVVNPAPGSGTSNELIVTIASAMANVSSTNFLGTELAPDSIVSAFGTGLATSTLIAQTTPLPTTLAGTTVKVRDSAGVERLAPLFFVSPTQINYLLPPGTALGAAAITVTGNSSRLSVGTVQIAQVAPGLFTANASGQGVPAAVVLRLKVNGAQSTEPVAQLDAAVARFMPMPIDLGPEGEQVFLILFGTGFRAVSSLTNATARIGGANAEVLFAGAQGGLTGLDQANLRIPRGLIGRGDVDVVLTVDGKAANTVRVNIK